MDNIALLEKEIELLTQKISLIKELRALETSQPLLPPTWTQPQTIPKWGCEAGYHDFPLQFDHTGIPSCKRCGAALQTGITPYLTTCTNSSGVTWELRGASYPATSGFATFRN